MMNLFLISAPSLGVYYCQQWTLSVCPDISHSPSNCFSFFVSRWNRAILWPSFLHVALYKTVFFDFYARQHICYSAYMPCQFRPSHVLCVKTAERIIEILSQSDRSIILVFQHQGSLRKSDGFTPNRGAKYKGVPISEQYAAISRKR